MDPEPLNGEQLRVIKRRIIRLTAYEKNTEPTKKFMDWWERKGKERLLNEAKGLNKTQAANIIHRAILHEFDDVIALWNLYAKHNAKTD
jgi:hypothetical protein